MKPTDQFLINRAITAKWYCQRHIEKWLLVVADLVGLAFALGFSAIVHATVRGTVTPAWPYVLEAGRVQLDAALMVATVLVFWVKGHYVDRRTFASEARDIFKVSLALAFVDAAIMFFAKWQFSRGVLLLDWMLVPVALLMIRTALKIFLIRSGGWTRPIVVVGWGENAFETALAFESERLMGYSLIAFLVPTDREQVTTAFQNRFGPSVPCLSLGLNPENTLRTLGYPHVVLALEQGGIDTYQEIIQELGRRTRNMQIVPSIRGLPLYGMEVNHFFAHEVLLLTVRNNLARRLPQFVKRIFDIIVSVAVLAVLMPLLIWIGLKVRASGGPIFYGHKRQGQHNKSFSCYKFRTMAPNADQLLSKLLASDPVAREEWERDFKLKSDPRITPIGRFLRRTSLDELPQIWNVLRGDMSLVGPRPVVEAELERYGNQVEYYLEAKPGITGLWQISGRNDVTYETRVYLDAWYVKNWSLFNDIVILLRTVSVIFRKEGAY